MTIDLDSTVCEVHGYHKQGAAYGCTHTLGYHPLLASRADAGEVLHARQRTAVERPPRGATGELTMRMDSGFWSAKTIRACRRHHIRYSITVLRPSRSGLRSPRSPSCLGRDRLSTVASPRSPRPATRVTG
jgi:hypothetical protein